LADLKKAAGLEKTKASDSLEIVEYNLRKAIYKKGQWLLFDYQKVPGGVNDGAMPWRTKSNDPVKQAYTTSDNTTPVSLDMSLVAGTVMEGLQAKIKSVNMNNPNWRDTVSTYAAGDYIYVLEDRSATTTSEKILKAGSTTITALDPVPDRLGKYRTRARAGRQLTLHLISVSDLPDQFNGEQKSALSLKDIEREWLRKKLYLNGTGQLLEWDHEYGPWRSDNHAWNADTNNK
jgi:hypothetical protein